MLGSAVFRTGVAPGGVLAGPWVRNSLWTAARAVPSLDLRFAENKSLVDATTGAQLVTFTRASSGTFVGSDGLIKSAVTNLLLRSEEFDNASWTKSNSSIGTNVVTAPNGSLTADKLIEDTAINTHLVLAGSSALTAGQPYVISVYLKAAERTFASIGSVTSGSGTGINLSTGTLADVSVPGWTNATTRSVTNVGNGWYRVAVAIPSATGGSSLFDSIRIFINNGTTTSYTGDGTSGIYIWGAQLEQSSTVGEYIPTTSTINSAPRFDHNPTTGESLGLLVEEQRTNLLLRSEEFATTWTATRASITSNSVTAPDGTTTADNLTEDTTASQTHFVTQSVSISTATSYTFSCFAKANTRPSIRLSLGSAGFTTNLAATFNLQGGTVIGTSAGVTASITPFSNDWYRCSATATSTATASTAFTVFIGDSATTTNVIYTGDGTSGIYLWGAQLEAGAFATSYIPTTTAAVTRSADVASISGSNFSSWYRQDEGTVFVEGGPTNPTLNKTQLLLTINNGSANNRAYLGKKFDSTTAVEFGVASGGVGQAFILTTPSSVSNARLATGYKVNDFAITSSGGTLATDTSGSVPVSNTQLLIGTLDTASNNIGGHIRRLTYWPTRLPNSTLQAVTQ